MNPIIDTLVEALTASLPTRRIRIHEKDGEIGIVAWDKADSSAPGPEAVVVDSHGVIVGWKHNPEAGDVLFNACLAYGAGVTAGAADVDDKVQETQHELENDPDREPSQSIAKNAGALEVLSWGQEGWAYAAMNAGAALTDERGKRYPALYYIGYRAGAIKALSALKNET